jgi:hypothetical protein
LMNQMHFHRGGFALDLVFACGVEMELQQLVFLVVDDNIILIVF